MYLPPWMIWVQACSFTLLFFGFIPTQTYLTAVFGDVARTALAILYIFFAAGPLISNGMTVFLGPYVGLVVAAATYVMFVFAAASHWVPGLIFFSALLGIGGALLWTSASAAIAAASTPDTLGRNSGVFFAVFRCSAIANLIVGLILDSGVSSGVVFFAVACVSTVGNLGLVALWLLRRAGFREPAPSKADTTKSTPVVSGASWREALRTIATSFVQTARTFADKRMLVLSPICALGLGGVKGYAYASFNLTIRDIAGQASIGKMFSFGGVMGILSALTAGWVFDRVATHHRIFILFASAVISCGASALAYFVVDMQGTLAVVMLYIISTGLFVGISLAETGAVAIINHVFQGDQRVAAFGIRLLLDGAGFSAWSALAEGLTPSAMTVVMFFSLLSVAILLFVFRKAVDGTSSVHDHQELVEDDHAHGGHPHDSDHDHEHHAIEITK